MSNGDLQAAAKVIAARERVLGQLGAAAAAPLDEDVLDNLTEAIAQARAQGVRDALKRLDRRPPAPQLRLADPPALDSAQASDGAA